MVPFHGDSEFKNEIVEKLKLANENQLIQPNILRQEAPGVLPFLFLKNPFLGSYNENKLLLLLGFPKWFLLLIEQIFSFYPEEEAADWLIDVFEAIPIPSNLLFVKKSLYESLFSHESFGFLNVCKNNTEVQDFLRQVKSFFEERFVFYTNDFNLSSDSDVSSRMNYEFSEYHKEVEQILRKHTRAIEQFEIQSLMYSIEYLLMGNPSRALLCAVSAATGQLNMYETTKRKLTNDYQGLACAFYSNFGGLGGFALKSRQEEFIQKIGKYLIKILKNSKNITQKHKSNLYSNREIRDLLYLREEFSSLKYTNQEIQTLIRLKKEFPSPDDNNILFENSGSRLHIHLLKKTFHYIFKILSLGLLIISYALVFTRIFAELNLLSLPFISIFIGIIGILLGRKFMQIARSLKGGDARYLLNTSENLVIYFRSFHDDNFIEARGSYRNFFLSIFFPRLTIEEEAIKALSKVGDVIAVGDPYSKKLFLGAPRIYLKSNVNWEGVVLSLMKHSKLSVFNPGYGMSIRKEMAWARQVLKPEQVMIYVPDWRWQTFVKEVHPDGSSETVSFLSFWSSLLWLTFGCNVRNNRAERISFFWFKPGWQLRPLPILVDSFNSITGSREKMYISSIQTILKYFV